MFQFLKRFKRNKEEQPLEDRALSAEERLIELGEANLRRLKALKAIEVPRGLENEYMGFIGRYFKNNGLFAPYMDAHNAFLREYGLERG